MEQFFVELPSNDYYLLIIMPVLICLATQALKMPIKHFTNKIKSEKIENRITALFMLLPLALGLLANFLYNTLYLQIPFSVTTGLSWGTASMMFYKGFMKIVVGKEPTALEEKQLEDVKNLANAIGSDGKIDKTDTSAVKDFLNKVK